MSEFFDTWGPRFSSVWEILMDRPYAVTALLLLVAYTVVARIRRKKAEERTGEVQPALLSGIRGPIKYAMASTEPVIARFSSFTPRYLVAVVVFLAAATLLAATWLAGADRVSVLLLVVLFAVLYAKYRPVKKHRDWFLDQVFPIAQTELKFQKGAELNREGYINIQGWEEGGRPTSVIVSFPSAVSATPARKAAFEAHWDASAMEGVSWTYDWQSTSNRVIVKSFPPLPQVADLPFPSVVDFAWNELPLGIGADGEPLVWDATRIPHTLVAGVSGSGKSMIQRAILLHVLQSPQWEVILIDPKRVELSMYKDADGVLLHAVEEAEMMDAIRYAQQQMVDRYILMTEFGVAKYDSLPEPPPALMVMVDELTSLLSETGDKEVDAGRKEAKAIVGKIAREGRAAGLNFVGATQRPDAEVMRGDTRNTIEGRIGMGRMNTIASNMILDDATIGTLTPADPRGRGVFKDLDGYHKMQGYFLADDQVDKAVEIANAIRSGKITAAAVKEDLQASVAPETRGRKQSKKLESAPAQPKTGWMRKLANAGKGEGVDEFG